MKRAESGGGVYILFTHGGAEARGHLEEWMFSQYVGPLAWQPSAFVH